MGTESKSGPEIKTEVHKSLKAKFKKKCKAAGTSQAQVLRDLIQKYVKEA